MAMGFVEQLKGDGRRLGAVSLCKLAPHGRQPGSAHGHVIRAGPEVVLVQDHSEARVRRVCYNPVEPFQPLRVDPILRVHMIEHEQIDPDEIEATVADVGKILCLEPTFFRLLPERVVTEDVDAPAKLNLFNCARVILQW